MTLRLRIDAERLTRRLDELSAIGRTPAGGVSRLAYTADERAAVARVAAWMEQAGLTVYQDAVGNLFGRWPAGEGAAVWTGSHLDSVPDGGRFDGAAGVLAGLAAIEALRASGFVPARPIELCVFVGEEGSRFPGGLLGSRAVVDGLTPADLAVTDAAGTTLADALRACGLDPGHVADARRAPGSVHAYVELHIEQGPVLERAGLPVGVVTAIAGPLQWTGEVRGRADHAGTAPMDARADSLLAVAELALAAERAARQAGPGVVATVGRVRCEPGAANVVPGRTEFTLDLRAADRARRDAVEHQLRQAFAAILARRGLTGSLRDDLRVDPVPVPAWLVECIEAAARDADVPTMRLVSGAAHDAMILARLAPSGMIFVRSVGGRSHTPEEWTSLEDIAAGTRVLAETLARLAAPRG